MVGSMSNVMNVQQRSMMKTGENIGAQDLILGVNQVMAVLQAL